MKRISAWEEKIRDYVDHADRLDTYFEKHLDEYYALCTAMDFLGDSCLALGHYESYGIGTDLGEKYLRLYGLLQGIFLQQDSIRQLYRTFLNNDLQPDSGSAWMKIRDLRNLAVGHPIEKKDGLGTRRAVPVRVSIDSDRFELWVWNKDQGETDIEDVDLKSVYESYKSEALTYLEEVHQAQVSKWGPLQQH